jgi:hypothetical protein
VVLLLDLIFVSISVLAFPIPRLIELRVGCFTHELHILNKNKTE